MAEISTETSSGCREISHHKCKPVSQLFIIGFCFNMGHFEAKNILVPTHSNKFECLSERRRQIRIFEICSFSAFPSRRWPLPLKNHLQRRRSSKWPPSVTCKRNVPEVALLTGFSAFRSSLVCYAC